MIAIGLGLTMVRAAAVRRNLWTRTSEFDALDAWARARVAVNADALLSPDGTLSADKLVEDATASNTHRLVQTGALLASTSYVYSVYAKAGERTKLSCVRNNATVQNALNHTFDLSAGTASGTGASISAAANGFYRCIGTFTTTATAGTGGVYLQLVDGTGATSYTGDGASGLYLWGAQLEVGSSPTEYQP